MLLKNPLGNKHFLIEDKTLRLVAWKISGRESKGFQRLLTLEEHHQQKVMNRPGEIGWLVQWETN